MKRFAVFLLKILSWLIHISPQFLKNLAGDFIGILWFDVFRIRRKLSIDNTRIVFPNISEKQRIQMVRSSLQNMGRAFMYYFSMPFVNEKNLSKYFIVKNEDILQQALNKKKGVLLVSLHMGAYDFAASCLALLYKPFYIISKHFNYEWLNDIWFGLRQSKGIQFIAERNSTFDIFRALKKNGIICFVIDQFMGPPIGIKSIFFGKETGSPMGLAIFAMKTKAPVVPVHSYFLDGKCVLEFDPEISFEPKDTKNASILHMTNLYNQWLEKKILDKPDLWMWVHRRWKVFKH